MEMMRQFNWRNEATALRYTDATKERGRKIVRYFNQVTPPKKRRVEEPVPGPLGVAGPSQAPISPEKEKTPPPNSPEKEKAPPPKSPEREKTPEPGNVSVTMEDEEDAFLYATASHVEEQAVAKRVDDGVEQALCRYSPLGTVVCGPGTGTDQVPRYPVKVPRYFSGTSRYFY